MSKYTTELRFICENYAGLKESEGYAEVSDIVDKALPKIFSFDFPIFDENHRVTLERKIVYHFYTREIGLETVGLWKLRLHAKLNEIMPYYNRLYEVYAQDFNPLWDTNITTEHVLNRKDNLKSNTNNGTVSDVVNRNLYSDTPQGNLKGVEEESYLSSASKYTTHNDTKSDGTYNEDKDGTDTFRETRKGKAGYQTYGRILRDFREFLDNIDLMIIEELEPLFFQLW